MALTNIRRFLGTAVAVVVAGCSSTADMTSSTGGGDALVSRYANARTVEEIRALKPQARLPLNVVVIPPGYRTPFSMEEMTVIEQWGKELKTLGLVDQFDIMPLSLAPSPYCQTGDGHDCYLENARIAGARMGADAILYLEADSSTHAWVNPSSILNLTIVGMWVVPAHHRDNYAFYEASLFDIDNGYLYLTATSRASNNVVRPYMYIDYDTGVEDAKREALNSIGANLLAKARAKLTESTAKPETAAR